MYQPLLYGHGTQNVFVGKVHELQVASNYAHSLAADDQGIFWKLNIDQFAVC